MTRMLPRRVRTPEHPAAIRWECQVGVVDPNGDLAIFDVSIETPDVRTAITRCCEDYPSEDIEWIKVRRV